MTPEGTPTPDVPAPQPDQEPEALLEAVNSSDEVAPADAPVTDAAPQPLVGENPFLIPEDQRTPKEDNGMNQGYVDRDPVRLGGPVETPPVTSETVEQTQVSEEVFQPETPVSEETISDAPAIAPEVAQTDALPATDIEVSPWAEPAPTENTESPVESESADSNDSTPGTIGFPPGYAPKPQEASPVNVGYSPESAVAIARDKIVQGAAMMERMTPPSPEDAAAATVVAPSTETTPATTDPTSEQTQ